MVLIVGGLELCEHEVDGADGGAQEEDLHGGVVHGYETEMDEISFNLVVLGQALF